MGISRPVSSTSLRDRLAPTPSSKEETRVDIPPKALLRTSQRILKAESDRVVLIRSDWLQWCGPLGFSRAL